MAMVLMNPMNLLHPTFVARVLSPSIVLLSALSLLALRPNSPTAPSPITPVVVATAVPRRALILTLLSLIALTYLLDGLSFVVFAVIDHDWPRHTGIPINTVTGLVAFAGLAALGTWKDIHGVQVWLLRRIKFATAAAFALDLTLSFFLTAHLRQGGIPPVLSFRTVVHIALPAFRALLLFPLLVALVSPRVVYAPVESHPDVEQPEATDSTSLLLPSAAAQLSSSLAPPSVAESSKYGTFRPARSTLPLSAPATRVATPAPSTHGAADKPEISFEPTWSELYGRIKRLSPYLWPKNQTGLQLLALCCVFILLIGRVINVAMPYTLRELIRALEGKSEASLWPYLFGYVGLRFLQGTGGLSAVRDCLWAPVMQYSDREMSQLSFDHLLNLSYAWHTKRKTGEILRVLDRGAAINHTLEIILFNIIPTFVDIIVALVVFCVTFTWTLALVVFIVMFAYVAASVILTTWRTRLRRQMNERDVLTRGIHTDCLLNYETVKYFCGEEHEGARYADAIREYQGLEYKVIMSLNLLNLVQNFIITSGLLIGSMMVAYQITTAPEPTAAPFVFWLTYLAQLYGPLNQLGYIYRSVNQSLVDTEKLLALLNEPTDVNDKEDALDLVVTDGTIEFDNVYFSYDDGRTTALEGVSFKVPKGSSVALVGESGSGKSTILRLLYRFYDLGEGQGRILIDGQDIRDVTQKSLRRAIGVVPQDSVLFNSSIGYNIGYGKFGATSEEIEAAAKSAQMHERILTFPDGYKTKVGERGIRLSGGEKQRVSIARTLLKNPPILLLDEATSALDTSTEKDIQKALQNLVKGRSSLSIAHRLSTIASADIILVLKDGQVHEHGNFRELIALDGIFASMWADQISSNDDAAHSIAASSVKKELSGYIVDADVAAAAEQVTHHTEAHEHASVSFEAVNTSSEYVDVSQIAAPTPALPAPGFAFPVTFPSSDDNDEVQTEPPASENVIQSPPADAAPIAFPASGDADSEIQAEAASEPVAVPSPTPAAAGVTFGDSVNSPPSRTDTPDPEGDSKRKRISSQNFQRLARRISLTTRRPGSSNSILPNLPGFRRDQSSPKVSVDDSNRAEGSAAGTASASPAGSVTGEEAQAKLKKKDKKRKGTF